MAEQEKEDEIMVPENYTDPMLEHPHQVVKGESVVTCNMVVRDPQTKVGQSVICPSCTRSFKVIKGPAE